MSRYFLFNTIKEATLLYDNWFLKRWIIKLSGSLVTKYHNSNEDM